MYIPHPIDTSAVKLPDDILELCEVLSKNTHEIWSENRIKDGWKYGEERDDKNKLHPCLIPYEQLPESEKDYDRHTSTEAIKLIIKLGYKITKDTEADEL